MPTHRLLARLPLALGAAAALALLVHGPIAQWPGYHAFADRRAFATLPNAADVLSNAGFAVLGAWGLLRLWPRRRHAALAPGWPGYALFLAGLILTAIGSAYYHLAPDNTRLIWDRLPIALTAAGLLAGAYGDTHRTARGLALAAGLAAAATASVGWWVVTGHDGRGDLRPYVFMQFLPVLLIPLWQAIDRAPRADRLAIGAAVALYLLARAAEVFDAAIFAALGVVSGHTLKHLLACAAAACIAARLVARTNERALHTGADRSGRSEPSLPAAQ